MDDQYFDKPGILETDEYWEYEGIPWDYVDQNGSNFSLDSGEDQLIDDGYQNIPYDYLPNPGSSLGAWPKFLFVITIISCLLLGLLLYFFPFSDSSYSELAGEMNSRQDQVSGSEKTNQPSIPVDCKVSEQFPHSIRQWCSLITEHADKRGLPPDLVAALILQESGGNSTAYSHSGAVGLMQVMPRDGLAATFMCKNGPCFADRPSTEELQDPAFNVSYGTKMLAGLVNKTGSYREALKSYGPMNVGYYYADIVLSLFQRYGVN